MTETELSSLSDVQIKKGVIKEWSGILSFMMRGVKFDDRIVNAFADGRQQTLFFAHLMLSAAVGRTLAHHVRHALIATMQ